MNALRELLALARAGQLELAAEQPVVNMHCHTFFSFNAYGFSPTALAWHARKRGFRAVGIVDFDVLDGVDEFLAACDLVGIRGSAGIETRVFIPQFGTREINSPGEPGVFYHMGIGFTSGDVPAGVAPILAAMRSRADRRNRLMLARLNAHLAPVAVDYEREVLPLTPAGNATERHMLRAIIRAVNEWAKGESANGEAANQRIGESANQRISESANDAIRSTQYAIRSTQYALRSTQHTARDIELSFWADKLALSVDQVAAAMGSYDTFSNLVRGRLMKRGGPGYIQPSPEAFPSVEEFHALIHACDALPCATWLDGLSAGEQAIHELLELLIGKGVVALNIIPDRNWNIPDPELRRLKIARLYEIVRIAAEYDLPLNVGTEMNAPGNKLVDDFAAPELEPVRQAFLDGAHFVYGHTIMQRALGRGYGSAWANTHLPTRRQRNAFYTEIGYRVAPGQAPPITDHPI